MPLWRLTPIDASDPSWGLSSHCDFVIARAKDEADARAAAAKAFDTPIHYRPGDGTRFPPWERATLVKVEHIEDARYEAEGPTAILEPSF